jgi:L-ascorbate 6-phosphate lactonase
VPMRGATITVLPNYDEIARRTLPQGGVGRYEEASASFLFETDGGNVLFLGDSVYYEDFARIGHLHCVDVAVLSLGHDTPAATHPMYLSPQDAFRLGQALRAKVLIPGHYDLWASTQIDPTPLARIALEANTGVRTMIVQWGGKFIYPNEQQEDPSA